MKHFLGFFTPIGMNHFFFSLKYNNLKIFDVTRQHNKKSVGLTIVMALIIGMAIGFTDLSDGNSADTLVHEFGDLLEGVEAEILSIPNDTTPAPNTADTMQTGKIHSEIAHLKAFDEIIKSQIL